MTSPKKIIASLAFIIGIGLVSCQSQTNPTKFPDLQVGKDLTAVRGSIDTTQKGINTAADKVNSETNVIRGALNLIEKNTSPSQTKVIQPQVITINGSANEIDRQATEIRRNSLILDQAKSALTIADQKIGEYDAREKTLTKERDDMQKERDAAVKKETDSAQKLIRWLIVICVIVGGAGIAIIILGKNLQVGLMVVAGAGSTMVLAIVVNKYFDYIAIGGLIILAGVIGYVIYQMFINKKALKEVVHTTEVLKTKVTPQARLEVFGNGAIPGHAFAIQSSSTEKLVTQARKELKPMLEHTINNAASKALDAHIAISQ